MGYPDSPCTIFSAIISLTNEFSIHSEYSFNPTETTKLLQVIGPELLLEMENRNAKTGKLL